MIRTKSADHQPGILANSAFNFLDGAISLGAAVVVSVFLARTLGPARFGEYALVTAIVTFAYVFAQLGVPTTVRRYVAELDGRGDRDLAGLVAGRGLRIGFANALVMAVVLSIAAVPLATFFHQPTLRFLLLLGAARLVPMIGVGVLRGLLGGLQQYQPVVRINFVVSSVWLLGCALAIWMGTGITGVLAVSIATESLDLIGLYIVGHQQVGIRWIGRLPQALHSRMVRYNWALAALVLLNVIVWQRSELLFLGRFSSAAQLSFYAVPFALTSRVSGLLPGAMLGVLLPRLTQALAVDDQAHFRAVFGRGLRYLAMLTLPICIVGIPMASQIIQLLYGSEFAPATVVLQILFLSVVFGVFGQASQSAHLGAESQGWLVKSGLGAAALSIVLDLALIPRWGAIGAAIANTTAQGVWAVAIFAPLSQKLFGLRPAGSLVGH